MRFLTLIVTLLSFTAELSNAQAQTCESLFEETSVLSRLTLEDQKVLTQFARKQVEVSINYSISRDQKESILRHIEDQLEYFIEIKGLSVHEELILRREYRSLVFEFAKESEGILNSQYNKIAKKQKAIIDQKNELTEIAKKADLLLRYNVNSLNEVLIRISDVPNYQQKHLEDFQLALKLGADIEHRNSEGRTPLHLAVRRERIEIIKLLLVRNANINALDNNSITPLEVVVMRNHTHILKLFLPKIKNIDESDGILITLATSYKRAETIEVLVENKANINIKHQGSTPLHIAINTEIPSIVELLIRLGANVNDVNKAGESPLHIAANQGYARIAKILIENNIDVNIRNNEGETALEIFENKVFLNPEYVEIVALIKGATK